MVTAVGELDSVTAPRLAELLTHRLRGTLHRVVVDLSEVDTLDAEGASVLAVAGLLARNRGIQFDLARGAGRRETRPLTAAPPQRKQDR